MFSNIISKLKRNKKPKCLLIIPPLLEPTKFYPATPILAGQLEANGYEAKNLDLNIRFFRTILTKEYIEKTKNLLDKKNIEYDNPHINFLIENLETAIERYKVETIKDEEYYKAKETLEEIAKFISLPYKNLNLTRLDGFEHCFSGYTYNYKKIKEMSFDKENNIFVSFFEEVIKEIKKEKFDFIGITIPFPGTIIPAFTLARLLKDKTKAHITLGGNFIKEKNILNNPEILDIFCDSVLLGDGEESIVKLVKTLEKSEKKENVSGLIYKNKKDIISNPIKPVTSLDELHIPSFKGINFNEYLIKELITSMIISKGCYWGKCTFCALGPKYGRYCIKKPEKVVADIKALKEKYNLNNLFNFQDDALHPNYLDKLADEIIKEDLKIYYFIFGRFEKEFTRELLEKLYKSGLRSIYWGLESGSQSVLEKMNKGIKLENVSRILKDCHEIGISSMAGIIVNFPTETIDEYNETIKFLETVKDYVTISPGNFTVMKNSIIEQNNEKYGIKLIESDYIKENEFDYCPTWEDTNIDHTIKNKRWNHFCECVKSGKYNIDSNKHL